MDIELYELSGERGREKTAITVCKLLDFLTVDCVKAEL